VGLESPSPEGYDLSTVEVWVQAKGYFCPFIDAFGGIHPSSSISKAVGRTTAVNRSFLESFLARFLVTSLLILPSQMPLSLWAVVYVGIFVFFLFFV